jgi:hypothetical protein
MGRACSGEGRQPQGPRTRVVARLVVALTLALALTIASAASSAAAGYRTERECAAPPAGSAACLALRMVPEGSTAGASGQAQGGADGIDAAGGGSLTPQQLHAAYSLPSETAFSATQTIAVIDAFDDPTAEADLAVYDENFGLPPCTSANGCFRKINEEGQASPLPAENGEWAGETSVDVQMAHALCANCRVLLVEARSEEYADLGTAVNTALANGATEISNSYGGPEDPAMASFFTELNGSFFDHPGVVVTAASGDCGYLDEACPWEPAGAYFPASSPDVVAVGGTTLTDKKEAWSSSVWDESGGGCSAIFAAPAWQSQAEGFAATGCGAERSLVDVAAVANPRTGVYIYDSTPGGNGEPTGWTVFGGTSVAAPIVAAEFALAGGAHGVAFPAATLYSHVGEGEDLYDVVGGSNGVCGSATSCQAAIGYDGPSGVGSPIGLGALSTAASPAELSAPTIAGYAEVGQTLSADAGTWSNGATSLSDQWQLCKASGDDCEALVGATGRKLTLTAGDVGDTLRVQETAGNAAGGFGAPASSSPSAAVVSDKPSVSAFTPSAAITGGTVTIDGVALASTSSVDFGALAAKFKVLSATKLEATVPDGATTGKITVTTAIATATSKKKFAPTLSVVSFTPKSGASGTVVTIKGIGFTSASTVSFAGVAANVRSASAKKLKVGVPAGAPAGAIAVTNTTAPLGTVFSAASFAP